MLNLLTTMKENSGLSQKLAQREHFDLKQNLLGQSVNYGYFLYQAFARQGPLSFLVIGLLVCTFALFVFLVLRMVARFQINQSGKQILSLDSAQTAFECTLFNFTEV